ncbi:MAG: hypothetical protein LQ346_002824 [Caloplaca aetnensis]|nr:MAG: hypothetical protein LQ346_002824 [Caloplaca aetnensis]
MEGALLGLPMMLSDDDIDQELPLEVDDICITEEAVVPMPPDKTSLMAAFNAHVRLVRIMAKTVRYVYPLHTTRNKSKSAYVVSHAKIREVEQDLQHWLEDLPMSLKPGGDPPPELVRVQQLLRIAYGHIQIILYRPFLHYASQSTQARGTDKRSYACAAACVSISRNLIHITSDMKKKGLLSGAYWFSIYTTFFAVLSLLFYVLENPENVASQGILRDAHEGRDTLASLSLRSMAADRSSQMLEGLFEQLPEALRIGRLNSVSQKKRSAPMQNQQVVDGRSTPQSGVQSPAGWSITTSGGDAMNLKRASRDYSSPTAHQHPMANFGSGYGQDSTKLFRLITPTSEGFKQSPPPMGATPSSATPLNLLPSNDGTGSGFPDLSTMMFPSNDPFAYPNQPMTTLENLNDNRQDQSFNYQMFNDGTDGESYEHVDPPFYGPLPSYSNLATQGSPRPAGIPDQTWAQQPGQARYRAPPLGKSWNAMFGEDWSGGWTDQGYGP